MADRAVNVSCLPIIDLEPFTQAPTDNLDDDLKKVRRQVSQELVEALHTTGFVYIKNHGMPQSVLDEAFSWSAKFFALPMSEKLKAPHPPGWSIHRGYSRPGLEKVSNATAENDEAGVAMTEILREAKDFKESYEIGSEDFLDMPNVWPPEDVLPGWRSFMNGFYWKCFDVCITVLRAIALGLGLEKEQELLQPHSGVNGQLRLLHYPPVPADDILGGKMARMPAHSDWSTLTILFQDNCGGLQVERPDKPGDFIDATPMDSTLVLNIGDLLMRWSNDYLKSTQHRVTLPPLQDRFVGKNRLTRARYSIPFFLAPDPDVVIKCLDLGDDNKAGYEPITQRNYAAMRARMQYE